jgi:DNA topoisomerase-2
MIHYFWPSLLKLGFVVSMVTPIIKASKGGQSKSFYTDSSFREWYGNGQPGWKIKYYKGLGTSTSAEAREYFKKIRDLTVKFDMDIMTDKSVILAFDKKKADDRKSWLLESTAKHPKELEVPYGSIKNLSITHFVRKDLVNFSLADLKRSIAHMADGLKPSQRKVMYACFHKNLRDEMKVAQLAAYVAEKSAYHHGEVSLADTIVKLANDYTGSNNINLLEPCGQFGTRLMGGKDASQTRYIFTRLTKEARKIFDPRDDPILNYLDDDGRSIEPDFYMPTLPMVLINGTEGIGTGFSCYVPPFNPSDIKKNIQRALDGHAFKDMSPWFRGFKGKIFREDGTWITEGVWRDTGSRLKITELPPGRWTQDYKEYLETLVDKKVISGFTNNSTTEDVDFEIMGYRGKDVLKDLKLRKSFHTSNMHLFHPIKGIYKYSSPEEILKDFVDLRIEHYKKRREHLIKVLEVRSKMCGYKSRFVTMVIEGQIIVFKRKKDDLERQLGGIFPKINGTHDYLLNIKTVQYTEECVRELLRESKQAREELEIMKNTSHIDMWKMDIKNM